MNEKTERGLQWLRQHPNQAFAVREIEEEAGLGYYTLARPLNDLVKQGRGGIVRADATYKGGTRSYRGFMYIGD